MFWFGVDCLFLKSVTSEENCEIGWGGLSTDVVDAGALGIWAWGAGALGASGLGGALCAGTLVACALGDSALGGALTACVFAAGTLFGSSIKGTVTKSINGKIGGECWYNYCTLSLKVKKFLLNNN